MIGCLINDRYLIFSLLGQGGMGAVYHAHNQLLDRDVAIKILQATDRGTQGRTRLLQQLDDLEAYISGDRSESQAAFKQLLLGIAFSCLRQCTRAADYFDQAISIYEKLECQLNLADTLYHRACLRRAAGQEQGASDDLKCAQKLFVSCQGKRGEVVIQRIEASFAQDV